MLVYFFFGESYMEFFELNNGLKIPALGLGTLAGSAADTERSVRYALDLGYRLIDTANVYYNEREVGKAINESGIDRKDIFLTTKIWPKQYKKADESIDKTLKRLNVDYIDLLLLHRPYGDVKSGLQAAERAVKAGKVKAIGLSNFFEKQFDKLEGYAEITPCVMQSECHPYMTRSDYREKLAKKGVRFESWFPLGHGDEDLLKEPAIANLAEKYGKSNAQIVLRWHVDIGNVVIPGSKSPAHIKDNFEIFDFSLTDEEVRSISALDKNKGFFNVPEFVGAIACWFVKDFDK